MSIEAMKQALETLEENHHLIEEHEHPDYLALYDRRIHALRTAIEQSEKQKPVGVVRVLPLGDGHKPMHWADWTDADNPPPEGIKLYTTPLAVVVNQQLTTEPAAQTRPATREEKIVRPGVYEVPEFNCPRCGHCCSQRQWVEVEQVKWEGDKLIAKLREKNGGQA